MYIGKYRYNEIRNMDDKQIDLIAVVEGARGRNMLKVIQF